MKLLETVRRWWTGMVAATGLVSLAVAMFIVTGASGAAGAAEPPAPRPVAPDASGFKPGDVGISLRTGAGDVWIHGDSYVGKAMARNAITLNGRFTGSIPAPGEDTWFWPGAAYARRDGRIIVYGSEVERTGDTLWSFRSVRAVRVVVDPGNPEEAVVERLPAGEPVWAAAATRDATGPLLYRIDEHHRVHAGRPRGNGTVQEVAKLGGWIGEQFSVVRDHIGQWWIVGLLPYLSSKVVAYPISAPDGRVTGPRIVLTELPDPEGGLINYSPSVHPDLSGLLTWAVNGKGAGSAYGLRRRERFWPAALVEAQLAANLPPEGGALAAAVGKLSAAMAQLSPPD